MAHRSGIVLCLSTSAAASSLPTPIWDPVANNVRSWDQDWPLFRNAADADLLPAPQALSHYVVTGGTPIGNITEGHANGGYNQAYYLMKSNSNYGTLDRNNQMRQFQEGMAMNAAQSPLPVGVSSPMWAWGEEWDTGAACARVTAPDVTTRSALVLVVDRFPDDIDKDPKVDMTWDLASLFVSDMDSSNRCYNGMNVQDTHTGKPCIKLQFVECSFKDSSTGNEVPLTVGFVNPSHPLNADSSKWNLRFQLNYKKRPVRAVRLTSEDGKHVKDCTYGYGQWTANHAYGTAFRIGVSYGDTDTNGNFIYQDSQPVKPSGAIDKKTSWDVDPWRYQQSDFLHVENFPLYFDDVSSVLV